MQTVKNLAGETPAAIVAIKNVCAWPNLTLLPDGVILALIHNQPSHLLRPGDLDCWASEDNGRTWEKRGTAAPRDDDKAARGHVAAGVAPDGNLIAITTGWSDPAGPGRGEITPTWVSRSADGGRTWQIDKELFPAGPEGQSVVPFGDILPGLDGHLRMAGYLRLRDTAGNVAAGRHTYIHRSIDNGRTWGDAVVLPNPPNSETALLHLGKGQWLAAARQESRGSNNRGLKIYVSEDDARTWRFRSEATGRQQHPGHLMRMKDGTILLSHGNRQNPRGVDVRFSDDNGESWSEPFRVLGFQGDGGYPSSVQLPDGQILTAYYAQRIQGFNRYHMGVVIWCPVTTRRAADAGEQPGTGEAPKEPEMQQAIQSGDTPDQLVDRQLAETQALYNDVGAWLIDMYDPATGGFHYSRSGKADPNIQVYIEPTGQAVGTLHRLGLIQSAPADIRAHMVRFFQDRHDPAGGFFLDDDPRMRASTRLRGRALNFTVAALDILGTKPERSLPGADGATDALPDHMKSPEAMRKWAATRDWKSGWAAADDLCGQAMILRHLPEAIREPMADALLVDAESRQNVDGFYGGGDAYTRMSGAFKMLATYGFLGRDMPRMDAVYSSTLKCLRTDPTDICFVYNALQILLKTRDKAPSASPGDTPMIVGLIARNLRKFRKPDGAFSRFPNSALRSLRSEAGVNIPVGHGRHESDMDATALAVNILRDLYSLAGRTAEAPEAPERFWAGIRSRMATAERGASQQGETRE